MLADISLQIAVSSWSVHHLLGVTYANGPGKFPTGIPEPTFGPCTLEFLDLPAELARRGYHRAEICHFHLASLEPGYLKTVRDAFQKSGVVIQTLLIDDGDLTDSATRDRDLKWIASWIEAAAVLGVENARVIAGKAKPSPEALALSVDGLRAMAQLGKARGVRIVTENWFDLLSSPREVHHVLDKVGEQLGFLADTGNWHGATKYDDLKSIFARAELCHAKCGFGPGLAMDDGDFGHCMKAAAEAGYAGPLTLIFESPGDEWRGLDMEHKFVRDYFSGKRAA
jgi:sugar phosphate isomerase/epimerase